MSVNIYATKAEFDELQIKLDKFIMSDAFIKVSAAQCYEAINHPKFEQRLSEVETEVYKHVIERLNQHEKRLDNLLNHDKVTNEIITKLEEHHTRQIDENRKISERVDDLISCCFDEQLNGLDEKFSDRFDKIEYILNQPIKASEFDKSIERRLKALEDNSKHHAQCILNINDNQEKNEGNLFTRVKALEDKQNPEKYNVPSRNCVISHPENHRCVGCAHIPW